MADLKAKLKLWLAQKTEDCKSVSPLFSYSMDRRLSLVEKLRVRLHLYTCGACLNYISNLKFMTEVFDAQEKSFDAEKTHVSLSPEAKERIKAKLNSTQ